VPYVTMMRFPYVGEELHFKGEESVVKETIISLFNLYVQLMHSIGRPDAIEVLVTEKGREVARAFRLAVQDTDYYRRYFEQDNVDIPTDVIEACLRTQHGLVFVGDNNNAHDKEYYQTKYQRHPRPGTRLFGDLRQNGGARGGGRSLPADGSDRLLDLPCG